MKQKLGDKVYAAAAIAVGSGKEAMQEFRAKMREFADKARDADLQREFKELAAWMDKAIAERP